MICDASLPERFFVDMKAFVSLEVPAGMPNGSLQMKISVLCDAKYLPFFANSSRIPTRDYLTRRLHD